MSRKPGIVAQPHSPCLPIRHGRSGFYQSPVRPASSAEFGPFLAICDALVAWFGVAADERFTAVLNSITKARQRYKCGVQCGVPHPPTDGGGGEGGPRRKGGVHARVPAEGAVTPPRKPKAEVYRELGYRAAGMVGVNLAVARPMVKAKGHIVQLIGSDGNTVGTLTRYKK